MPSIAGADALVAISVRGVSKTYRRGPDGGPSVLSYLASLARQFRGGAEPSTQEAFWALKDVSFEIRHGERVIWIEAGQIKVDGPTDQALAEHLDALNAEPVEPAEA